LKLDAVLVQLLLETLHGERRVGEIPGVRVDLSDSHGGEEPPGLDGEAVDRPIVWMYPSSTSMLLLSGEIEAISVPRNM